MNIAEISPQLVLFGISVVSGFIMGSIYDIIRIFRRIIFHNAFFMFVEDLIYWILSSAIVFVIMLAMTKGEIRFFAIGGFFTGMCIYFLTLSLLIISISEKIIYILKKIIFKIIALIKVPFKILSKFLHYITSPFNAFLTNLKKYVKKLLQNNKFYAKIKLYIRSLKGEKSNERNKKNERS